MGSHIKQFSLNIILISTLLAPISVRAESSPGSDYFKALIEKKPKNRAEMVQIRKETYDKAVINQANTLSKVNADHTKKVEEKLKAAERAAAAKNKKSLSKKSVVPTKTTPAPSSNTKSDIKVESNLPDEMEFSGPEEPKTKKADAVAPAPKK